MKLWRALHSSKVRGIPLHSILGGCNQNFGGKLALWCKRSWSSTTGTYYDFGKTRGASICKVCCYNTVQGGLKNVHKSIFLA